LSRGGYELLEKKLIEEKRKIPEEKAAFTEDPSFTVEEGTYKAIWPDDVSSRERSS